MKRRNKRVSALLLATFLATGMISTNALAAEKQGEVVSTTEVIEDGDGSEDTEVRTGTLGDNNGFQWTYEEETKTLTVTGEDSGLVGIENPEQPPLGGFVFSYISPFNNIDSKMERIILRDCKLKGSAKSAFSSLEKLKSIEFVNVDTSDVTDMSGMFAGCESLTSLDVSNFDTSNVTNMSGMFDWCIYLTNLDISGFDTSNVTDMSYMFRQCSSLESLDVSSLDTVNVTDMSCMFSLCSSLTSLDISTFETTNVTRMYSMFSYCSRLKSLDVSALDTSGLTSLYCMFQYCTSLENIDISTFDTSNVTDMYRMFYECDSLESVDLSVIDTSKVENMEYMFAYCDNLQSLDMSGCDLSNVEKTAFLMYRCDKLTTIHTPIAFNTVSELPAIFCDTEGNRTSDLTGTYCNKTLIRKPLEILAESAELTVGSSQQLSMYVNGVAQDTPQTGYEWTVDSDDVLTVNDNGVVTAVGMGTATVTCTQSDNAEVSATCEITVRTPFSDIKVTDWQYPYVVYAYENNLMSGKGDGKFDMNGNITRSEFVTVLYSYSDKPEITFEDNFTDVASDDWFANAVTWAKKEGVSAGNPDGTFGAYNNITREQLVAMLYQYAIKNGVAEEGAATTDLTSYADLDKVSAWAVDALTWAVENDIISGKVRDGVSYFDPKESTTRGECATMMMRYVELAEE